MSQEMDSQAKKARRRTLQVAKKDKESSSTQERLYDQQICQLKDTQTRLMGDFVRYKERKYWGWLKVTWTAMESQKKYLRSALEACQRNNFEELVTQEPLQVDSLLDAAVPSTPAPDPTTVLPTGKTSSRTLRRSSSDTNHRVSRRMSMFLPSRRSSRMLSTPSSNSHSNVQEDYLLRRTSLGWQRRWCVLRGDVLDCFKSFHDVEKQNKADETLLLGISTTDPAPHMKRPHCFSITTPLKVYYFQCSNKEELDKWLSALKGIPKFRGSLSEYPSLKRSRSDSQGSKDSKKGERKSTGKREPRKKQSEKKLTKQEKKRTEQRESEKKPTEQQESEKLTEQRESEEKSTEQQPEKKLTEQQESEKKPPEEKILSEVTDSEKKEPGKTELGENDENEEGEIEVEWVEYLTSEKEVCVIASLTQSYYYNLRTRETVWERPEGVEIVQGNGN